MPVAGVLLVATLGCTTRQATTPAALPVTATATPQPQQNDQTLTVQIDNGHFNKDIYQELPGATRLVVSTQGGPYLFSINNLVDARQLQPNTSTQIDYEVSDPGRYVLRAQTTTAAGTPATTSTAVLDVRPAGGR
jgi:hypothetical protein